MFEKASVNIDKDMFHWDSVWPVKSRQMSIKVAQNDSTRKMKDFDAFTKIA